MNSRSVIYSFTLIIMVMINFFLFHKNSPNYAQISKLYISYSMIEKIIHSYVNKLTKEDILNFAYYNNIVLNNEEVDIIYTEIKNNWRQLLSNPTPIFERVKSQVSPSTYQNIIYFYDLYSKKLPLNLNFR